MLLITGAVDAAPADSGVRIPSHGGSGTVIATGDGWTLILSCAHCFEGRGRAKATAIGVLLKEKEIAIDMRSAAPGEPHKFGFSMIAVGRTADVDLALVKMHAGPVPYVSPVAPLNYSATDCWSVGFDDGKFPAQVKSAKIVGTWGANYKTDSRPWHGRSGGGLIDKETGYLVGVCSAYTGPSNRMEYMQGHNGIYVSLQAIHNFLVNAGVMQKSPEPLSPFSPFNKRQNDRQNLWSPSPFSQPDRH